MEDIRPKPAHLPVAAHILADHHQETSSTNGETGPSPACAVDFSPILKYDDPVLAKPHAGFDMGTGLGALPQQQQQQQYVSLSASSDERPAAPASGSYGIGGIRNRRRPHAKENNTAALKAIIPNKEWIDEAGTWVQTVSLRRWCILLVCVFFSLVFSKAVSDRTVG